jgi:signal transduction histidine kinase
VSGQDSFLDSLGEYLREVEVLPSDRVVMVVPPAVEPAFARNAFIRALERLGQEKQGHGDAGTPRRSTSPDYIFGVWQQNDEIVRFSERMAHLLSGSIGKDASDEDIHALIEVAIARQVGLSDSLQSRIKTLELDRLAKIAKDEAFRTPGQVDRSKYAAYASAIRATRGVGANLALTPIGRIYLELTGRDAIRWLLHVEAAQSFGPSDPWRLSRETALSLMKNTSWVFHEFDEGEDGVGSFPHRWETIRRMGALGLVSIRNSDNDMVTWLDVLPLGMELLAEIASEVESPLSVLANSLISDLTLSAAESGAGRSAGRTGEVQAVAVAEATARHARMVAHEIRNMLVPVKTTLGAFYREILLAEAPGEVISRRREGIDRGIDAIFRFIDQLVELSKFAATPPEPLDVLSAIRDALSAIEMESGQRIVQALPASLPPVSGFRARVVMALTNLLRNAVQVTPQESPIIRIQAESIEGASAVRIFVEDNGPGVPEEMRRAIFDEGISLRGGGSGLGLALVREVFEKEMKGLVACEASPLGGARFVMRIPTTGMERR